jgi:RNA polymerase primary sigma factor
MPVHVVEKLNQIGRAERALRAELGRDPLTVEIAGAVDLDPAKVETIRHRPQTPVSLDKPVGDEDGAELGHFLTDDLPPLPEDAVETTIRNETIRRILEILSPRERRVIELRYGLDGEEPRTLDEIGRTFSVTRERIRQIENQSLKKLRAPAVQRKLGLES